MIELLDKNMIHFDMNIEDFRGKAGFNQEKDSIYKLLNQEKINESRNEHSKNKPFNKWRVVFNDQTYNTISTINLCKIPFSRIKK